MAVGLPLQACGLLGLPVSIRMAVSSQHWVVDTSVPEYLGSKLEWLPVWGAFAAFLGFPLFLPRTAKEELEGLRCLG